MIDNINQPAHYLFDEPCNEAIDVVHEVLSEEELRGFFLGNTLKYLLRHKKKGGDEDLRKASKNLNWLIEMLSDLPSQEVAKVGFEIVDKNRDIKPPTKNKNLIEYYDIYAPEKCVIHPQSYYYLDTGIEALISETMVLVISSMFGLHFELGDTMSGYVVLDVFDCTDGRTGNLIFKLFNPSDEPVTIEKGEKILEGVFMRR